jgi:DNA-binding NtrC family response regulator
VEHGRLEEADLRAVRLRLAEIAGERGRVGEAGRRAREWRKEHGGAPEEESVRAARLEARGLARDGRHDEALALLDEAQEKGASLPVEERLETALVRAAVLSLAGRFSEEIAVYERWRKPVVGSGEETLLARLLFREALGLADRRRFPEAIVRLEQALAASRDDIVERARISLCLASTLYHAGREEGCRRFLDEAIELAGRAGREDLVRTARANRLELLINAGEWERAASESRAILERAAAEGDDTRLLVALHHASRLALRRGLLAQAARDNARARELAGKLADRLETGELWLEEGDRLLYEGNVAGARQAYETAAADPPDRCDSGEKARGRLRELSWIAEGDVEGDAAREAFEHLAALFERDEYAAAEQAARWRAVMGSGLPAPLRARAERVLRRRGGEALADAVFGAALSRDPAGGWPPAGMLRELRTAAAAAMAGEPVSAPLSDLGLRGIAVSDADSREILRLGSLTYDSSRRRLDAGASSFEMALSPPPPESVGDAVGFVLETLLFRMASPPPPSDFSQGWKRLGVVAADASMEDPYRRLVGFAPAPVTVLVRGESGSGKEAVARAVHALSPRAAGPFVAVNVPAIPAALLESELFGHARGAFTGADRDRKGLLEEAERGTIFFDEIGDLNLSLQAKLLRALQEREIRRVGENRPRRVDVRVVSATSRDLEAEVEAGRFREDLYYRLHVAVIALPPLRKRGRDIPLLARHFLDRCAREFARGRLSLAPDTIAILAAHPWPGNVRELQNAVSQAAALAAPGSVIGPDLLPASLRRRERPAACENYRARVDEHRRGLIHEALARTSGNRSRAARELGLSRQALAYLIRELGVTVVPRGHNGVDSR